MQPLRSVLAALAERPDVLGAVVVSDEGLVIEAALPSGLDPDAVAALTAGAQRAVAALSATTDQGVPSETVVASPGGTSVLVRLPSNATLLLLASPEADLGHLLYELRRHSPALTALV